MSWDASLSLATLLSLSEISSTTPDSSSTPILKLTQQARDKGFYDSVCAPLTTEKWKKRWTEMCLLSGSDSDNTNQEEEDVFKDSFEVKNVEATVQAKEREARAEAWRAKPCFELGEVTMTRLDEAEGISIAVSDWLELDAADDWIRHDSEIALRQEISYASYLNIHSAIIPPPRNRAHIASYARAINACLKASPYMHLSIQLPPYDPSTFQPRTDAQPASSERASKRSSVRGAMGLGLGPKLLIPEDQHLNHSASDDLIVTWEMWDIIRSMCDYSTRLSLALDLSLPLPTVLGSLSKWTAEPVKYIFLPSSAFVGNTKGYPVLPKVTQSFLRTSTTHRPTVILSSTTSNLHTKGGEAAYSQYMRHLERSSPAVIAAKQQGTVENFAQGYQDYLQAPLQPLMDNLQSVTYQTFEQDPVKYMNYEEAMYRAFFEWPTTEQLVVCVAGAGRGPLVARCIKALQRSRREAIIYALEKNPNAFVTLQNRQNQEWASSNVKLVYGDMRAIQLPEKVDVLVSELLGSFGDNELSPECLDGASRFLKPEGISIPSSYTAHLAPLSSSKLYNEARASKDDSAMETPYVVMFQSVNILSDSGPGTSGNCGPQVQECWEFEHPRKDALAVIDERGLPLTNSHNVRAARLNFHIPHAGVLHGLAGYFEAVLYGNVGLSIHPDRKDLVSKDMLSWFPLFFPFKDPLYLPSNSELQVSIWRLSDERRVWYEWHAEAFLPTTNMFSPPPPNYPETEQFSSRFSSLISRNGVLASPLIDASTDIAPPQSGRRGTIDSLGAGAGAKTAGECGLIKIGQTSLSNPGGRGSWIGL